MFVKRYARIGCSVLTALSNGAWAWRMQSSTNVAQPSPPNDAQLLDIQKAAEQLTEAENVAFTVLYEVAHRPPHGPDFKDPVLYAAAVQHFGRAVSSRSTRCNQIEETLREAGNDPNFVEKSNQRKLTLAQECSAPFASDSYFREHPNWFKQIVAELQQSGNVPQPPASVAVASPSAAAVVPSDTPMDNKEFFEAVLKPAAIKLDKAEKKAFLEAEKFNNTRGASFQAMRYHHVYGASLRHLERAVRSRQKQCNEVREFLKKVKEDLLGENLAGLLQKFPDPLKALYLNIRIANTQCREVFDPDGFFTLEKEKWLETKDLLIAALKRQRNPRTINRHNPPAVGGGPSGDLKRHVPPSEKECLQAFHALNDAVYKTKMFVEKVSASSGSPWSTFSHYLRILKTCPNFHILIVAPEQVVPGNAAAVVGQGAGMVHVPSGHAQAINGGKAVEVDQPHDALDLFRKCKSFKRVVMQHDHNFELFKSNCSKIVKCSADPNGYYAEAASFVKTYCAAPRDTA